VSLLGAHHGIPPSRLRQAEHSGGDLDAGPARAASRQSVESDALEHGMLLA